MTGQKHRCRYEINKILFFIITAVVLPGSDSDSPGADETNDHRLLK
jgi:hypothetical protein